MPFNTDVQGPGLHWLLASANFRTRDISICNSIHSSYTAKTASSTLLKIVACICTAATEYFKVSDWTVSEVINVPQQDNGYDCGVFTILHACAVISSSQLGPVNSNKARLWIHSLVEEYKPGKTRQSGLSQKKVLCYRRKVQSYDAEVKALVLRQTEYKSTCQKLQMDHASTKNWTLCYSSKCKGDPEYLDEYILCVICRRWFHIKCMSTDRVVIAGTDYQKCLMCSS